MTDALEALIGIALVLIVVIVVGIATGLLR